MSSERAALAAKDARSLTMRQTITALKCPFHGKAGFRVLVLVLVLVFVLVLVVYCDTNGIRHQASGQGNLRLISSLRRIGRSIEQHCSIERHFFSRSTKLND